MFAREPPPTVNFNGTWVNKLGSKMELKASRTGEVDGSYATAVGNPPKDKKFDLRGFASGEISSLFP
jgi:hypothetical protein